MKKSRKKIINLALAYTVLAGGVSLTAGCNKEPEFSVLWEEGIEDSLTLQQGESFVLFAKRDDNQTGIVTYAVVEGSEYATINSNGVLTVSKTATVGQKIKVQAISDGVKSSTIEITVAATREIVLTSNATSNMVVKGTDITLNTNYKNTTDAVGEVTYKITAGSEYATITNNVLKVNSDAPAYSVITVISESAITTSNTLTFIVVEEAPQFTLSWDESMGEGAELQPGESLLLLAKRSDNQTGTINYTITVGNEYVTVTTGGLLQVSKNAPVGQVIKVKASCDGVESNEFTVTVIETSSIVLTSNTLTNTVSREDEITLTTTYRDTTDIVEDITYRITAGSEYATLVNNKLIINEDAVDGASITVIAESSITTSNTLTFTVFVPSQRDRYLVYSSEGNITVDSTSDGVSKTIKVQTIDGDTMSAVNLQPRDYSYEVLSGRDYVSVDSDGVLTSIGHGVATVKVTYVSEDPLINDAFTTITVNSILPPETIELNEMLTKQATKEVSKLGFGLKDANDRSLNLGIVGNHTTAEYFANTYKVNVYVDGATTPSTGYATFDNVTGKLTFDVNAIGHELRVEVLSDTGANKEARAEFTVNVNDGYNIYTPQDLRDHHIGTNMTINLLADCIIEGDSNTIADGRGMLGYKLHYYGDTAMYGNGFKIDFSKVENKYSGSGLEEHFITITNILHGTYDLVVQRDFDVKIYDLSIYANNGYNKAYSNGVSPTVGSYNIGIYIEGSNQAKVREYLAGTGEKVYHTYLDINNVNINGFQTGMRIGYATSKAATEFSEAKISKVSNVVVENCLESGIETYGSIMTFENIKLGRVGTTGIETTPDQWWTAGENFNQPQTITFKGTFISDNYNAFNNTFVNNSESLRQLPTIVNAIAAGLKQNVGGVDYHFESFATAYIKENQEADAVNGIRLIGLVFNNIEVIERSLGGVDQGQEREFVNGTVIKFEDLNGEATDLVGKIKQIGAAINSSDMGAVRQNLLDLYQSRFVRLDVPTGKEVPANIADILNSFDPDTREYLSQKLIAGEEISLGGIIVANPLYDLIDKNGNVSVGGQTKALADLTVEELVYLMQVQEVVLD